MRKNTKIKLHTVFKEPQVACPKETKETILTYRCDPGKMFNISHVRSRGQFYMNRKFTKKDGLVKGSAFAAYITPFLKICEQIGLKLIFESERKKMYHLVLVIVSMSK